MSGAESAKHLLIEHSHKRYRQFLLNDDKVLILPSVSSVPWVGLSKREDCFEKKISHPLSSHHVKFIFKNHQPAAFVWQTSGAKLKQALRSGIVRAESITGKVISSLGQYRITAYTRAAKGMVSNSQAVKLKLLDLYQDRFEALQSLESMVNKNNTYEDYDACIDTYIERLFGIKDRVSDYFSDVEMSGLTATNLKQIRDDIAADIQRIEAYRDSLKGRDNLRAPNRARGHSSILEFVKQQMLYGLYELQGINQDISYSRQRYFVLTRGEFNDVIEDARKNIDDHLADPRNIVMPSHHGEYNKTDHPEELISYDFSEDEVNPAREREILLAISFIEGWDQLDNAKGKVPSVTNGKNQTEELDVVAATKWKTHRNFRTFTKSIGYFFRNIFKSIIFSFHPWEEETWKNKEQPFHLTATRLRAFARPNEPMWKKTVTFIRQLYYAIKDLFNGVRDVGAKLAIRMPIDVVTDWESTNKPSSLQLTLSTALTEYSLAASKIVETQSKISFPDKVIFLMKRGPLW